MTEGIPFIDLASQRRRLGTRLNEAVLRVIDHGQFIMGPEIVELELGLKDLTGARHVVTCSSGTDAILLAIMALGLRRDDAVIVPAFTFPATPEAVALLGGVPVFADVDPRTFLIDPESVAEAVSKAVSAGLRPVGIIGVDLFGQPADYPRLREVAEEHGLWVLADAAQSMGGCAGGRSVGSLVDITATSFFPAKPLGCFGDGGAVLTANDELAGMVRSLRSHGMGTGKYDIVRIGINGRLDTIQAAVLLSKLTIFSEEVRERQIVAERYGAALQHVVLVPKVRDECAPSWAQYTIQVAHRDLVAEELDRRGIPTCVYYPTPLHHQAAYAGFPRAPSLAVSERLASQVLSLPMHPYLSEPVQAAIVREVIAVASSLGGDLEEMAVGGETFGQL